MLIIGINGSPNAKGNTAFLVDKILEQASTLGAHTQLIQVAELVNSVKQPFCVVCSNPCTGACYKGTPLEVGYELLRKADGVIIGSPTYFGTVTAQLKAFFDKTRKLRREFWLYNTVGAGVTVGGSKYGGQEATIKALHDIMLVQGMVIVGDGFGEKDAGHHGVVAHRPADQDEFASERLQLLGKRLVQVCDATQSIRKS
ncbi:MAG TPA: flavodoxin family protein [Desulfitobacterium dehalogenans]|uniref:Flavodoxin family protein n=1 Tax=Desulfitobacterium dehalogenans TaxID=36854 RepID=A0A7C6Z5M2_9FIRM|nr:flavodoxin family protein [Desulfitobacterium dehalogenans]